MTYNNFNTFLCEKYTVVINIIVDIRQKLMYS